MPVSIWFWLGLAVTTSACAAVNPQAEQARAVGSRRLTCPEGKPEAKLTADHGDSSEWEVGCNFESVLVTCYRGGACRLGQRYPRTPVQMIQRSTE